MEKNSKNCKKLALGKKSTYLKHPSSPVSLLKRNVLHELKLRDPYLMIYPVGKATKDLYYEFTDNAINITGKLILPIFSNGWSHKKCHFFLTEGHERNILGNDNLSVLVKQNK